MNEVDIKICNLDNKLRYLAQLREMVNSFVGLPTDRKEYLERYSRVADSIEVDLGIQAKEKDCIVASPIVSMTDEEIDKFTDAVKKRLEQLDVKL